MSEVWALEKHHSFRLSFLFLFPHNACGSPLLTDFENRYIKMHALVQGSAFWGFDYKHLYLMFSQSKVETLHYGPCRIQMVPLCLHQKGGFWGQAT